MKVLLIASACHPEIGSESAAGWKLALNLAGQYAVHVITQAENRDAILKFRFDSKISQNLAFTFIGSPPRSYQNRMIARIMSWVIYFKWLREVEARLAEILKQEQPDLIHHATIATWRVGIPWLGYGIPVVWGPLGGAATFPARFLGGLSVSGAFFEVFRNIGNSVGRFIPSVKRSCRGAAAVICGNKADAEFIKKIRGNISGVHVLSSVQFSAQEFERFQQASEIKEPDAPLQAFAGGICIGSKGIQFALEALALANEEGTRVSFTVASFGPELGHLKKVASKLGLQSQVRFHAGFQGIAYEEILGKSHVFLLPSFREGSPRTILEAMLAGAVPVVCRASAQGEIVDDKVGFAIPPTSRRELVRGLTDALILLDRDRERLKKMSRFAQSKVLANNRSESFLQKMGSIYQEAFQAREINHCN